jgi:hypothetical protein
MRSVSRSLAMRLFGLTKPRIKWHSALAFIAQALPLLHIAVPGLRNEGLFAFHALTIDAQRCPEWASASEKVRKIAARKRHDLLAGLGFKAERFDKLESAGNHAPFCLTPRCHYWAGLRAEQRRIFAAGNSGLIRIDLATTRGCISLRQRKLVDKPARRSSCRT